MCVGYVWVGGGLFVSVGDVCFSLCVVAVWPRDAENLCFSSLFDNATYGRRAAAPTQWTLSRVQ